MGQSNTMAWSVSFVLISLPILALSYRPVHLSKNLFVQAPVLDEGTRVIRRSPRSSWLKQDEDERSAWEQPLPKVRNRREVSDKPESSQVSFLPIVMASSSSCNSR